nr:hypothetical protein [Tanacetum cinerariifolium]
VLFVLGLSGEGRGSGVEVVEWREKRERVVLRGWRENQLGVVQYMCLNVGMKYCVDFGVFTQLVPLFAKD